MELLGDGVKWKLVSVYLDIVLILTQDTCMVCTERTICSEIILNTPDDTPIMWVKWKVVLVHLEWC
jgi:hypothetical protein